MEGPGAAPGHYANPGPPRNHIPGLRPYRVEVRLYDQYEPYWGEGGHRDGGPPQPGALRGMPCKIGSLPRNHIPGLQPYRIKAHPLVSTVNYANHVGEGGAVGPSAVCARLKTLCKMGSPPKNHHGIRAPSNVSTQTVSAYRSVGPGERDTAFARVNEYPRHGRGSKRKTVLTWAAALLGHQEANRHLSWRMCVPCGTTELIHPFEGRGLAQGRGSSWHRSARARSDDPYRLSEKIIPLRSTRREKQEAK
ncbi:hypothetical protein EDB83DRAFT_2312686 [Lactarius deliciosus]|nr:hypothetical protein EDB83DRAFT_2312686 [Lactarius deliciosus]